jgi:hypothetical protein
MKLNIKILTLLLVTIISSVIVTKQVSAQGPPQVSFQVFYDQLSPYGQWVDYPEYGYVWLPDAGRDFAPYSTGGHWIFTEYGWTWVSDYYWGWAPFHYGRWDYDNYYGWFWVPDIEWGPAWVSWRRAEGYYGWAPMEPGISISVSFGRGYDNRHDHWIFVRDKYIGRPNVNRYYVGRSSHDRIVRNSTVINNTYVDKRRNTTYISGPGREEIQKVTGRRVTPVTVQENSNPGQDMSNGQYRVYRPEVMKNDDRERKPVPARVMDLKDVKQPSERRAVNQPERVRQQQQNTVKQQSEKPVQENRRVEQPNTVKQQREKPAQENRRVEQPNTVKQQSEKPVQENRRVEQPNTVKQQSEKPSQENRRVQQTNSKKQSKEQPAGTKTSNRRKKTD